MRPILQHRPKEARDEDITLRYLAHSDIHVHLQAIILTFTFLLLLSDQSRTNVFSFRTYISWMSVHHYYTSGFCISFSIISSIFDIIDTPSDAQI